MDSLGEVYQYMDTKPNLSVKDIVKVMDDDCQTGCLNTDDCIEINDLNNVKPSKKDYLKLGLYNISSPTV